jgi:hypothetical protein
MAVFERYVPKMADDINETVKSLYKAYVDVVDQLDWLLNQRNLDSRNIREIDAGIVTMKGLAIGDNVDSGSVPQVFHDQPTTPYRVNDIWIDGENLMRCKTARATGAFDAGDWELGTNYTNPTGVTTIVDGVVTTDYVNALNVTAHSVAAENITGSTITGKTLQTATTGTRIVISPSSHQYLSYVNGVYAGSLYSPTGTGQYGLLLSGSQIAGIRNDLGAGVYANGTGVQLIGTSATFDDGSTNPQLATRGWVTQNFGSVPAYTGYSTITATTGNGSATHNHGITPGTVLMVNGGGTVTFVASGDGHTHTVTAGGSHRHTL